MYTSLRPSMSDTRPMGSRVALMVRAYPMMTHWTVGRSVWKCSAMVGRATLTLPWSTTEAKRPMAIVMKPQYL